MTLPNSQISCYTIVVIDAHVYATKRRHSVFNDVAKKRARAPDAFTWLCEILPKLKEGGAQSRARPSDRASEEDDASSPVVVVVRTSFQIINIRVILRFATSAFASAMRPPSNFVECDDDNMLLW